MLRSISFCPSWIYSPSISLDALEQYNLGKQINFPDYFHYTVHNFINLYQALLPKLNSCSNSLIILASFTYTLFTSAISFSDIVTTHWVQMRLSLCPWNREAVVVALNGKNTWLQQHWRMGKEQNYLESDWSLWRDLSQSPVSSHILSSPQISFLPPHW